MYHPNKIIVNTRAFLLIVWFSRSMFDESTGLVVCEWAVSNVHEGTLSLLQTPAVIYSVCCNFQFIEIMIQSAYVQSRWFYRWGSGGIVCHSGARHVVTRGDHHRLSRIGDTINFRKNRCIHSRSKGTGCDIFTVNVETGTCVVHAQECAVRTIFQNEGTWQHSEWGTSTKLQTF